MAASFTSPQTLLIIKNLQAPTTKRCRLLLSSSTCLQGTSTDKHLVDWVIVDAPWILRGNSLVGNRFGASKSWGEELCSVKRHRNPAVLHSRPYCGAIRLDYHVFCIPRVISGFWMGPDIEDGWGFIEATMNQI